MRAIGQTVILLAVASTVLCNELYPIRSHGLQPRQDKPDITVCPLGKGISALGDIYNHFMLLGSSSGWGITSGFAGPVATNASYIELSEDGTTIAKDKPADCKLGARDIYSYGLVSGSDISTTSSLDVYGNIYSPLATTGDVTAVGESCSLQSSENPINFTSLYDGLLTASKYLYDLSPDYKFDSDGNVTLISEQPAHPSYHVFTLDTCYYKSPEGRCSGLPSDFLSSPTGIFYDGSLWSGPDLGKIIDDGLTIVVNIPLTEKLIIPVTTDSASAGFPTCRTIFNMYPVSTTTAEFSTSTSIAGLKYMGKGLFEGLILGPKVWNLIMNNPDQHLGGKFFNAYVDSPENMVEDFTCGSYQGCFPVADYEAPESSSSSTSEDSSTSCEPETTTTTVSTTTTTTTSAKTLITTDTKISTVVDETTVNIITTVLTSTAPTTLLSTKTRTFTITDASDPTTTTRIFTSLETVIIPVENE